MAWPGLEVTEGESLLSEDDRVTLRKYAYSGQDKSLLYKYLLSPWADFCVQKFTPLWMAPNTITTIGFVGQLVATSVAVYYSRDAVTPPPTWSYLLSALCMFAYSTMDNMDGKQARRTGSSSPLGLLFDHGLDALNCGLCGWILASAHTGAGTGWRMAAFFLFTCAPFYYNTWEEYHTGSLVLPLINGPNEGVFTMIALLLGTAYVGPTAGVWHAPYTTIPAIPWLLAPAVDALRWFVGEPLALVAASPVHYLTAWAGVGASRDFSLPGAPITLQDMLLASLGAAAAFTVLSQFVSVITITSKQGWRGIVNGLLRQMPFAFLAAAVAAWNVVPACTKLIHTNWLAFYGTAGALFVDMTVRLMLAHVTHKEVVADAAPLFLFGATPALISLAVLGPESHGPAASAGLLWAGVMAWGRCSWFVYTLTCEVAAALDIDIFDIRRQVERAKGGAAAAVPTPKSTSSLAGRRGSVSNKAKPAASPAAQAAVLANVGSPVASPARSAKGSTSKPRSGSKSRR